MIKSAAAVAMSLLFSTSVVADIYSFESNVGSFDNENAFTHEFQLDAVDEILAVEIELTHTYAADVDFTLKSPLNQTFVLSTDKGGAGDLGGTYRFVNVFGPEGGNGTFSPTGANDLIPAGTYDAESWITPFNGWDAGTWTLILSDDRAGDGGSSGTVSVTYASTIPEPAAAWLLLLGVGTAATLRRKKRSRSNSQ